MRKIILFCALILAVGCGGKGSQKSAEQKINVDSMIKVLAVRYDAVCKERKAAFEERDPELRKQLLDRNDRASLSVQDSLKWLMSLREKDAK